MHQGTLQLLEVPAEPEPMRAMEEQRELEPRELPALLVALVPSAVPPTPAALLDMTEFWALPLPLQIIQGLFLLPAAQAELEVMGALVALVEVPLEPLAEPEATAAPELLAVLPQAEASWVLTPELFKM